MSRQGKIWTDDPAGPSTDVVPTRDRTFDLGKPEAQFNHIYVEDVVIDGNTIDSADAIAAANAGKAGYITARIPAVSKLSASLHLSPLTTSGFTQATYVATYQAPEDIMNLTLVYGNYIGNNDAFTGNDIQVKACVQYTGSAIEPVFFGVSRTVTITNGAPFVESSPVGVYIPKDTTFTIRTWVSVASSGMFIPLNTSFTIAMGEGFVSGSDVVDSTTAPTLSDGQGYGPFAVYAQTRKRSPKSVCIMGDSIATGYAGVSAPTVASFVQKAFNDNQATTLTTNVFYQNIARPSAALAEYIPGIQNLRYRDSLAARCNNFIMCAGNNDIQNNPGTLSSIKANLLLIANKYSLLGNFYVCTITPRCISSNSFATAGGQTNQGALVTGAANNGSGLIRITAPSHAVQASGQQIIVANVGGVPNATGTWVVTRIDGNTLDLVGSTFAGTYTSGGTISRLTQEQVRVGYNDWLRDTSASGAIAQSNGTIAGVFDIASKIEVNSSGTITLNGGLWLPGNTTDGVHPNTTGHSTMRTAIDAALFV